MNSVHVSLYGSLGYQALSIEVIIIVKCLRTLAKNTEQFVFVCYGMMELDHIVLILMCLIWIMVGFFFFKVSNGSLSGNQSSNFHLLYTHLLEKYQSNVK